MGLLGELRGQAMDLGRLAATLGPLEADEEPASLPRGFHFALNYTSSVGAGVDAQPAVRLLAGAARRQLVSLHQLVLQAADVSVLRRELHHRVGRLGAADALERFLQRGL